MKWLDELIRFCTLGLWPRRDACGCKGGNCYKRARNLFPEPKRRFSSFGYRDGTVRVRWYGQEQPDHYRLSPAEENHFLNSPELYIMMQLLKSHPEGVVVKMGGIEYRLAKEGSEPTKIAVEYGFR